MNFEDEINDLKRELLELKQSRVYQTQIVPGAVKQRHLGESNKYVWVPEGVPQGHSVTSSTVMYFSPLTNELFVWNSFTGAYVSVTLT